jgi:hypothetical protein
MLVFVRPNSSYVRPKLKVIGQMSCQVKYLFAALGITKFPYRRVPGPFLRNDYLSVSCYRVCYRGWKWFHMYLIGAEFTICTDHKALEVIYSSTPPA